jgi:hypothetical protein
MVGASVPVGVMVVTVVAPVKLDVPLYRRVLITATGGGVAMMTVASSVPVGVIVVRVIGPDKTEVPE